MGFFLEIDAPNEPFDLPVDEKGRAVLAFNISAVTRGPNDDWEDQISKKLEDDSVGTRGTDIFIGSVHTVPSGDGPYLVILPTPGAGPLRTQNQDAPSYQRPSAQIVVRAKEYAEARTMIRAAYNSLTAVRNQTLAS